jgi:signal transduction histidine kinase
VSPFHGGNTGLVPIGSVRIINGLDADGLLHNSHSYGNNAERMVLDCRDLLRTVRARAHVTCCHQCGIAPSSRRAPELIAHNPRGGWGSILLRWLWDEAGVGNEPAFVDLLADTLDFQSQKFFVICQKGRYRLFTNTDETTGLTITVAETTRGRQDAILGAAKALLWPLTLLIPLNILIIWLAVRGAMRPVLRVSRDIAERGATNLAPLDISDQPGELRPIAVAIARLMGRLRAAIDAERAFAANSAHELRTPIAGALAQTQRLIAESSDPSDRRRARDMETTFKRLSALAEKLMQISRVDAGLSANESELDLVPALDLVVADCAKALDEPGRIHYVKPSGAKLVARMDMDAFAIAVRNLIDNAVSHGPLEAQIDVKVAPDGVVRIGNEGPIVPPRRWRN